MLTLILVRHAEALSSFDASDHERKLTPRGEAQAVAAGLALNSWGITPSLCLSSDARRAVKTAELATKACGLMPSDMIFSAKLYQSYTTQQLIDNVASAVENHGAVSDADCVMVVGHNPDISYRADALSREPLPTSFPTAGVLALLFDADNWRNVSARSGSVLRTTFF